VTLHVPGMMPVGHCCRTCQQRIMISLHEQIRITGDSRDTASGIDDPYSEETSCSPTHAARDESTVASETDL